LTASSRIDHARSVGVDERGGDGADGERADERDDGRHDLVHVAGHAEGGEQAGDAGGGRGLRGIRAATTPVRPHPAGQQREREGAGEHRPVGLAEPAARHRDGEHEAQAEHDCGAADPGQQPSTDGVLERSLTGWGDAHGSSPC
jgi:hypothetical protein